MTPTTDRILHYIARYRGDYECGPSIRDICRACGVRSTNTVHYTLAQLRAARWCRAACTSRRTGEGTDERREAVRHG